MFCFGIFRVALLFICQGAILLKKHFFWRTFVLFLRKLIQFIISSSVCQELFSFYFQVSFETRLLITHSNSSLFYQNSLFMSSSFFIFLNFFSEIRVAFVRRNSRKFYQDYSSMSSIFSSFLKKEVPSHSLRWNFSIALSFFSCQPVFAFFLLFYNPLICKTYFHPYLIRCGTYYLQTSGVEVTYS